MSNTIEDQFKTYFNTDYIQKQIEKEVNECPSSLEVMNKISFLEETIALAKTSPKKLDYVVVLEGQLVDWKNALQQIKDITRGMIMQRNATVYSRVGTQLSAKLLPYTKEHLVVMMSQYEEKKSYEMCHIIQKITKEQGKA